LENRLQHALTFGKLQEIKYIMTQYEIKRVIIGQIDPSNPLMKGCERNESETI